MILASSFERVLVDKRYTFCLTPPTDKSVGFLEAKLRGSQKKKETMNPVVYPRFRLRFTEGITSTGFPPLLQPTHITSPYESSGDGFQALWTKLSQVPAHSRSYKQNLLLTTNGPRSVPSVKKNNGHKMLIYYIYNPPLMKHLKTLLSCSYKQYARFQTNYFFYTAILKKKKAAFIPRLQP